MQERLRFQAVLAGLVVFFAWSPLSFSQALYSFVDENGVRNFTNMAPKGVTQELKITGAAPVPASQPSLASASLPSRYDPIIERYAIQYRLDPSLVRSMIATESSFNSRAISPKGARGLMQLMPETAARVGVFDVFDPDQNIHGGIKHMRTLLDRFDNDLVLSLAAYNAGENLVQRIGRVPNIRETHDYVRSITNRYGKKQMTPQPESAPNAPPMFRFVDGGGVLHLTNIAPVYRPDGSVSLTSGQAP